jgi:crossover junction endodeoxyribonuclease RuvC
MKMANAKRILGIDPGLIHTGWAVIESEGGARRYLASGVILPGKKDPLAARLASVFNELGAVADLWRPDECSIEITFVNSNPATTLLLGHARAAAILAAATRDLPLFEYEPTVIKKAITGAGRADKAQIGAMVRVLLPAASPRTPDEADAIAIALAHSNYSRYAG